MRGDALVVENSEAEPPHRWRGRFLLILARDQLSTQRTLQMSIGLAAIYCFNKQLFRIPSVTKFATLFNPPKQIRLLDMAETVKAGGR
jgi:hypothetical protein